MHLHGLTDVFYGVSCGSEIIWFIFESVPKLVEDRQTSFKLFLFLVRSFGRLWIFNGVGLKEKWNVTIGLCWRAPGDLWVLLILKSDFGDCRNAVCVSGRGVEDVESVRGEISGAKHTLRYLSAVSLWWKYSCLHSLWLWTCGGNGGSVRCGTMRCFLLRRILFWDVGFNHCASPIWHTFLIRVSMLAIDCLPTLGSTRLSSQRSCQAFI